MNTRFADAYAWLGQVRASLGTGDGISLIRRAITLEPSDPSHRIRAAQVLLRQGKPVEARAEAQAALELATDDRTKREAQALADTAAGMAASKAPATAPATPSATSATATAAPVDTAKPAGAITDFNALNALNDACQSGDKPSCARLLPTVEAECAGKNGRACGFAGYLYEQGRGPAADPARAAELYRQACDVKDTMGCINFALLQARGNGVAKDAVKAQALLNGVCSDGEMEACTQLALLVAAGRTEADLLRTRELLNKACGGQHARACELLKTMPKPAK